MAKHPQEDLFASSTMSFGDHLEELRKRRYNKRCCIPLPEGFSDPG